MKIEEIVSFLTSVDSEFHPTLSSQVDFDKYAARIISDSNSQVSYDQDGKMSGLVVLYDKDQSTDNAYIPLVAVRPDCRHQGIAKKLMLQAIETAKNNGKYNLRIHSNNGIAIAMYLKMGFEPMEGNKSNAGHTCYNLKLNE